jgi:hypothetical protein
LFDARDDDRESLELHLGMFDRDHLDPYSRA